MAKKESPGAALVRQRYEKMTPEERKEAARNAAVKRWAKARKEERAAHGKMLAEARAKKAPKKK